jgi:hypothetical protein
MKVKRILNNEWDGLFTKPLIYMGFFLCSGLTIGIAMNADGVVLCSQIAEESQAKQSFFRNIIKQFPDAPIAMSNDRIKTTFAAISNWDRMSNLHVSFLVKGDENDTEKWSKEIENFFATPEKKHSFSKKNPINLEWLV